MSSILLLVESMSLPLQRKYSPRSRMSVSGVMSVEQSKR